MQNKFGAYNKEVMERFTNPRFMGEVENPDGDGQVGNMRCGDIMRITFKLDKDKKIKDIKFETLGCAAAIAVSSVLTQMAKGKTLAQAKKITDKDVVEELGNLPNFKLHCSNLGAQALQKAIGNYEEKNN